MREGVLLTYQYAVSYLARLLTIHGRRAGTRHRRLSTGRVFHCNWRRRLRPRAIQIRHVAWNYGNAGAIKACSESLIAILCCASGYCATNNHRDVADCVATIESACAKQGVVGEATSPLYMCGCLMPQWCGGQQRS
jgi:hypothetical protein